MSNNKTIGRSLFATTFLVCIVVLLLSNECDAKFPKDFMWGAATAAYQVEGAHNKDGRGPSIWDVFSHTPGKIADGTNGDDADDLYNRLDEDIDLMVSLGLQVFRFSISWSRVLPTGELPINQQGIDFYNKMIDKLLAKGIIPFVTLYHWDLPEDLEALYGGWLNGDLVDKFLVYADICFREFGDRVKYWLTFNEPHTFILHGYQTGLHAPGRCSNRLLCPFGNSTTEPYIAGHTVMRAHAYAVDLYRTHYYPKQQGKIGITLDGSWIEPYNPDKPEDQAAAQRAMIWHLAWFGDPVYFGEYPKEMRERVGNRLPKFTAEEKELLKKSMDFFGLNHYWSSYAYHDDHPEGEGYFYDRGCYVTPERNGVFIGPQADSTWFWIYPKGMRGIINWVWKRYNNPEMYITENGVDVPHESYIPLKEAINDTFRIKFYEDYIGEMEKAVLEDGVNMRGYMAWSLLDNFEWADGNEKRFGMVYVDYKNKMERYPKNSAYWYRDFIKYQTTSATEFISEYHSNAKSQAQSLPKSEQMNHEANKSETKPQHEVHPEHHHVDSDKPHPPQPELASPQLQNAESQSQAEGMSFQ